MKAALLEQLHQPLRYTEVPTPTCGPGEVLVELKAAALNHRDVWIQKGLYPNIKTPLVLGSDGAGVVAQVGEGVADYWLGKKVVINPSHHWGDHPGYYGDDYKILGLPDQGTFAEYVKVEARYLAMKPSHLSFEQTATLPLAGLTAWRALMTRASFREGERVLVTGAGGGVALFAVQFALAAGAEVWVTSGSDEKIRKAVALGARGGVNYKVPTWYRDLLMKVRAPKRGYFDVIIDGAGGAGFARLLDLAAPGGRICFYGGTAGNITDVVPAKAFFKQLTILGTTMGTEAEFEAMLRFVEDQELMPVVDELYPLQEAEHALRRMDAGEQFGKIVLTIES
ncbi:zinc-binding dehydrogenase [Rhabdobacter roseus]|uniref:NADPH:quinone reductase-like Zn-dependent oxidoreductase n=1 Tax=Rhabdobacter roseus TaxID=1655419 RepID=A0A840TYX4_9BACT|nr:zinc-binding dehydrogenase [Rhabdobacter roseus]MBB5286747.1 NADPH:quinone reductase-like Zn-dependent oxidoreductase [Rhabdobacter roseus]